VWQACRTSNDEKAIPFYGTALPKSCECWRQLLNTSYDPIARRYHLLSADPLKVAHVPYCYERKGVPPEKQFSDVPRLPDSKVSFYVMTPDAVMMDAMQPVKEIKAFNDQKPLQPLDACPDRCNERGMCEGQSKPGTCRCRKGWEGTACEKNVPSHCMNGCSGRGECQSGFCKCVAGYWGLDCSRSRAYEAEASRVLEVNGTAYSRTRLRIYRYELPWHIAFPTELDDCWWSYDAMYGAFEQFYNQFSGDWAVRTENPGEANLFYVPVLGMYRGGTDAINHHVRKVMHFVRDTYPHLYNRNQGRDHFIFLSGDRGACWLFDEPEIQNPIKLTHFGLQVKMAEYIDMPGWDVQVQGRHNPHYECFKFEKDVVVPCNEIHTGSSEIHDVHKVYEAALAGEDRKYLLYFGGGFRHTRSYSGGARQAYKQHVLSKNDPRVKDGGHIDMYRESVFCFNPYGDGWGNRLPHIILGACIPVTVQDHVHQPFDEVLPYQEFSIQMRVEDVPDMLDVLAAVDKDTIIRMRRAMYQIYRSMYWEGGGMAYNYTLLALKRKLCNLWGRHY